ncbi:hypothetical protein SAMN03159496_05624 [Rhizobium sp. NFR07]|uniref:hypothetical protein n=1 Tax=Rhizobium sp. NFR07 TaxID=1566262 RepID=UPI0008EB4F14|nr:hypothetical protein [Rhizobium sp. NFR07]SFB60040.1 hypothetical protein SAMN03159496_05624 [Rhizobium sp. NFR07]
MTLPVLRDYRAETINMSCKRCDRHGVYDRKALVKKLGAAIEFVELRRILAIGCDRRGTDGCEASFPCLLTANILIEAPYER